MNSSLEPPRTVVFALCGSFCTFETVLPQIIRLRACGWEVLPMLSYAASALDTRFGRAADWKTTLIYYPLSPKLLLCAVHPNAFFQFFSDKDGCLCRLDATKEESFIASMNRKQRAQCHNQVFALTQTTLEKIKL